jgi:hypothetical protein
MICLEIKCFSVPGPVTLLENLGFLHRKMNVVLWYGSLSGLSAKGHTWLLLIGLE